MADQPPELHVRLAGPYHFGTVERIVRDLDHLFAVVEPVRIDLDLRHLTFISPAGLALTNRRRTSHSKALIDKFTPSSSRPCQQCAPGPQIVHGLRLPTGRRRTVRVGDLS